VSIENIEKIAVPSITPVKGELTILDEIGKMECFSAVFKDAAVNALDSPDIIVGTITLGGDDFIQGVRNRTDVEVLEVTKENRDSLPDTILGKISDILRQRSSS